MRPLANLRVISRKLACVVLIMMDSDEKLIYLVQKYECLFNPKAKNYSDKHSKNNAWEKVSVEMKLTVPECQKQWKKLRDCYKKALRLRQYKSGSARKTEKPIKFEELEFLKPHLQDRSQTSNLDFSDNSLDVDTEDISIIESQTSDVGESSRSDSALSNHTTRNKPLPLSQKLFKQYVEAKGKEEDPLDAFFISMSESVKKMPIRTQAELKRAILGLVTDAEVKLASEESSDTPSSMINCYGTQQQQIYSSPSSSTYIPPPTYCPPPTSTTPPNHSNYGTISNTTASAPPSPYIPQPISRTQQQRQSKFDEFEEFTYND